MAGATNEVHWHFNTPIFSFSGTYEGLDDVYPSPEEVYGAYTSTTIYPSHRFAGWNTADDGTGDTYQPGDAFNNEASDYYGNWVLVDEEDLVISNYSLISIADAIRVKKPSVAHSEISVSDMATDIITIRPEFEEIQDTGWSRSSAPVVGGNSSTTFTINATEKDYPFVVAFGTQLSGSSAQVPNGFHIVTWDTHSSHEIAMGSSDPITTTITRNNDNSYTVRVSNSGSSNYILFLKTKPTSQQAQQCLKLLRFKF